MLFNNSTFNMYIVYQWSRRHLLFFVFCMYISQSVEGWYVKWTSFWLGPITEIWVSCIWRPPFLRFSCSLDVEESVLSSFIRLSQPSTFSIANVSRGVILTAVFTGSFSRRAGNISQDISISGGICDMNDTVASLVGDKLDSRSVWGKVSGKLQYYTFILNL